MNDPTLYTKVEDGSICLKYRHKTGEENYTCAVLAENPIRAQVDSHWTTRTLR